MKVLADSTERKHLTRLLQEIMEASSAIVVLIGSRARGTTINEVSDIDLLYIGDKPVRSRFPEIQLIRLSRSKFESRLQDGDDFVQWALRYGVPIYGRSRWHALRSQLLEKVSWPKPERQLFMSERQASRARTLKEMGDLDSATEEASRALAQIARAILIRRGVFPLSRPELARQLDMIDEDVLASWSRKLLIPTGLPEEELRALLEVVDQKARRLRIELFESTPQQGPA